MFATQCISVPLILALSRVSLLSRRSLQVCEHARTHTSVGIRTKGIENCHGHAYWHPIYLYCFLSTMGVISCLTLSRYLLTILY
ncbi:hypothetical protein V8E55_008247 [Tylopilus felleus]